MRTPRRKIPQTAELFSLAVAIVLVLLITLLSYRTWAGFSRSNQQVKISQQVKDGTDALLSSLKGAETGQRGFLLTGQDRYLDLYRQALTEVPGTLDRLADSMSGLRPDQAERLKGLRPLVKDKLDELGQTIQVRRG